MKFPLRTILLYGAFLAVAAIILQWLEYQYLLRRYSTETYIIALCILFTAAGIWFGKSLLPRQVNAPFQLNLQALHSLGLSEREAQVLTLLCEGHSNSELANKLHVSVNTVKSHLKSIYEKLGVSQRGHAIRK
ncbi:MAG: LuxR C-terminal-related transcriptional regulator, partial [Pseudomonadales bacterium]